MREKLSGLIIWLIVLAMVFLPMISDYMEEESISLSPNDWARITDMEYKAVVVDEPGSQGKIVVTERITFDVHAASKSNPFWELWRDLCEDYIDGLRVHYKVNSVKQILPDGQEVEWEESPKLYWNDSDYESWNTQYGPGKWYHSEGPYNEYSRDYECVFFYIDGVYREEMVFEIEYEMYNAVLRYGDCSDLYISMYSGDTIKYLESFKGQILIPEKDMPKEGNYQFTTYGTNANNFPVVESDIINPGYHTFSFELDEDDLKFKSYNDYIEFDLVAYGEDKHIFAENASKGTYYNDEALEEILAEQKEYEEEPAKYKSIKLVICIICILISLIVVFVGTKKIGNLKQRYPFYDTESPCATYRDIPSDLDPKFAAALVTCKEKKPEDDAGVYSALLLSLARKGYVELQETSSSDVLIKLTGKEEGDGPFESLDMFDPFDPREPLEPLTPSEIHYFNLIKRHAATYGFVGMNELQRRVSTDYSYTSQFEANVQRAVVDCGISLGYLQKANYLEPKKTLAASAKTYLICGVVALLANLLLFNTRLDLLFGGLFILGAAYIATGIYLKSQAHKYVLLTAQGEREYKKWRGLYNFLKSDTLMNERTVIELPLWEKYLVYATAFGISEKVIAAIKIRCPEIIETKSIINSTYCRSGRIRVHGRSFRSSVHTGSRGFHSSGGGFGGGGYGGGGRGGGGGGGGH